MKRESFDTCKLCGEVLLPGEPRSPASFDGKEVHLECGFRAIVGGGNHLLRICTCCGGTEPPDPAHMTKREAARWALQVSQWVRDLQEAMQMEAQKKRPAQGGPSGEAAGGD